MNNLAIPALKVAMLTTFINEVRNVSPKVHVHCHANWIVNNELHQYVQDNQLILNFSIDAIQDFEIDNDGISGIGSFGGKSVLLQIPFSDIITVVAYDDMNNAVAVWEKLTNDTIGLFMKNMNAKQSPEIANVAVKAKPKLSIVK